MRTVEFPPFRVREWRGGRGSPVVLLHGLSGSSSWWRRNVGELTEHHSVAALDLPMLPHFEDAAALVARWIESSFDEPVHLIGHSMGGMIAIRVAASRPELARSLVLVNATGIPFALDARSHLRHLPHPPRGLFSFSRVLAWDFLRAGPAAVAATSARLLADDARKAMMHLALPTLLVWGDRDPLLPERYAEDMRKEIAGSTLVVLPNAGHVSMWDNAGAFNRVVLEFFRDVDQERGERRELLRHAEWSIAGCTGEGMCYRLLGERPKVVLIHGLGMSSSYFAGLALALEAEGFDVTAPDLMGFGYSPNRPALPPRAHARALLSWAEELGIEGAVWIGHSTGNHVVRELAAIAPERIAGSVFLAPIWSSRRRSWIPLAVDLIRDVFREPLRLVPEVLENYWRVGLLRWLGTLVYELRATARGDVLDDRELVISGERDPLMDWKHLRDLAQDRLRRVPGAAHAVNFSHPAEVATAILPELRRWLSLDYTALDEPEHRSSR